MSSRQVRERTGVASTGQRRQAQRQRTASASTRRLWLLIALLTVLALVAAFFIATFTGGATCRASTPMTREGYELADASLAEDRIWTVTLHTCSGSTSANIIVELDGKKAPQAVANFISLARNGYFDDTGCHRLVTEGIYVLQCGDPTLTGRGDPGYSFGPIENAPPDAVYPAGTLAMARRSGDASSMGSQFFLVYEESTIPADAAGGYTVFGTITSGLDFVQAVADAGTVGGTPDGEPANPVTIEGVETS